MSKNPYCCANCLNLKVFDCPSFHFWCSKNKNCPCNGDETPNADFCCDFYERDDNLLSDSQLKALQHICKLEEKLLESGVTPSCIYMNDVTHSLLESPDTIIGYPVVVDNKLGDDIVCLA